MDNRVVIWDVDSSVDFFINGNDIVLVKDKKEESVQWLKAVVSENGSPLPQNVYSLKAGSKAYNVLIFAKYLQYKLNKAQIVFATEQDSTNTTENLFFVWEKVVSLFKTRKIFNNEHLIDVFETYIEKEPFFSKKHDLIYIIKLYHNLVVNNYMLKYSEEFEYELRCNISYPNKKKLQHQLNRYRSIIKKNEQKYKEQYLTPLRNTYRILNKMHASKKISEYLIAFSSYVLILAKLAYYNNDFSKTLLLCHRTLDLYFFYLLKLHSLPEKQHLFDKYKSLIQNSIFYSKHETNVSIDFINKCRNYLLYTHGNHTIKKTTAFDALTKTIKIITDLEGPQSLWTKFEKMELDLDLNYLDIFSFEYSVEGYYQKNDL